MIPRLAKKILLESSMSRQFAIVIPARLDSTRLPSKLLLDETGMPLICHTIDACRAMEPTELCVASSDVDILRAAEPFCLTIHTSDRPRNGTERLAEVMDDPQLARFSTFVNVQGDEPEAPRMSARHAIDAMEFADLGTIGSKPLMPSQKGVRIHSRPNTAFPAIPFAANFTRKGYGRLHHGIYAFRRSTLAWYASTPPSRLEKSLKLEQMRFIERGKLVAYKMIDGAVSHHPVDDKQTYQAFCDRVMRSGSAS